VNIYDQFREYVSSRVYTEDTLTELHHEPPRHTGESSNDSKLNIRASLEDHALLHYYRWLSFGNIEDKAAWMWRKGQSKEARKLMIERSIKTRRAEQIGFFNSDFQSVQGRKGAIASHEVQEQNSLGRWNSDVQRHIASLGNTPECLKKKAEGGRKGGKKSIETRRKLGVGVFNPDSRKKGNLLANLSRWGIVINGERIPRSLLPPEFIEWFLVNQVNKFTIRQSAAKPLSPEGKVQRLLGELGVTRNTSTNAQNDSKRDR
jgi:hypothetical protein